MMNKCTGKIYPLFSSAIFHFLAVIFLSVLPSALHAEATKEFTRDAGFYRGTTVGSLQWSQNNDIVVDHRFNGDSAPPEGLQVSKASFSNETYGGWGIFCENSGGNVVTCPDFSDYSAGAMRFWLKSNDGMKIEIEYKDSNTNAAVTVASTGGQWNEIVLPLSSFSGVDFTKIRGPFKITAVALSGTISPTWYIDHVRWTKPVASLAIFPTTTTVTVNQHRQFSVEGRDKNNDRVIIYSTFSATAAAGKMNPASPNLVTASTLTAAGSAGSGTVSATLLVSTSANVSVVSATIDQTFGLLSETIPGLILDTDSKLFYDSGGGGGAADPVTVEETGPDVREGSKRFKTTIHPQSASSSYSGWLLNWGLDASTNVVKDFNAYYDGSIRFWFKGPSSLQTNLIVGIYSVNCDKATELSKVKLSNYVTFDDQWHPVTIPLKDLAKARPWADLSRLKTLFDIFALGNTGSSDQSFYIDNLRLDTRAPGALASMTVTPNPVLVPLNGKRMFTAHGFDANGVPIDIWPVWSKTDTTGTIGTLSSAQSVITLLNGSSGGGTGTITATQNSISSATAVTVASVTWTQSYNVYSDAGSGGFVGVSTGGASGTQMLLSEQTGGAPEGLTVRRATYTLVNTTGQTDAYAVWFTDEQNGSRYMRYYKDGYLHFWVKTARDLQFSLRSNNIAAGTERCKFRLSELGIPLDGAFQKVVVALADFKGREPNLDFDQIKTYFVIGALSNQIGQVTHEVFDVDDVKWLTANPDVPDETKVYQGLKEKQQSSGLVRSYETLAQAVTYDQALAAMNYTYRRDDSLAKKVFDVYNTKYNAGGFNGFHNTYNVNTPSTILDDSRLAGPNAWMLLALIHYKNVTADTKYDAMIDGVATWLKGLQVSDGGIQYGYVGGTLQSSKSTEHNFDCYAAFTAYATLKSSAPFITAANNVLVWLSSTAYDSVNKRFFVGQKSDGSADTDKALDVYSWAPLALSSFTQVLATAETGLRNTKTCDLTGVRVDGFDMGGLPAYPTTYTDAVWLEGTGQMSLAYYSVGNKISGDYFLQQLDRAIVTFSTTGAQGMAYATNGGTGFGGFTMDSLHVAASPAAWYLFSKKNFNPFKPFPLYGLAIKNIGTNVVASSVTWTVTVPARWVRADRYVQLDAQPVSTDPWGIQIYTDNTNAAFTPRFVDPTPAISSNTDSDPAGLLRNLAGQTTTYVKLSLAWEIQDSTSPLPSAVAPFTQCSGIGAANWFFFKDRATPAIDGNGDGSLNGVCDGTVFSDGEDYITMKNQTGLHTSQGKSGYSTSLNPDYVYFETDFTGAAAQVPYQTQIVVEFFLQ